MTCKHRVKDKKQSTWNNDVYRTCRRQEFADGFCSIHHPDTIERESLRRAQEELQEDVRALQRREEAAVGRFMRVNNSSEFFQTLLHLKTVQALAKDIGD